MLPQKKLAWSDRKKKPKSEMTPGKCGANHGKASSSSANRFHKTSGSRPHEGRKISYCVTSSSLPLRGSSGTEWTLKKNTMAQNPFLPPIMAMGTDNCISKQTIAMGDTLSRGPVEGEGWGSNTSSRYPEKESAIQGETLTPLSSPGLVINLITGCWEHKTFGLDDLSRSSLKKTENPDLYGSCLLVLASRGGGVKDSKTQLVHDSVRRSVDKSQRYLHWSKACKRGLSAWRSFEELNFGKKGMEKQSSGDSAFGTDTWSENAEVDLELGLELNTLEMDHYTHQRITNWILQVNAALFSPHAYETLKSPLTEQDTSIKIVYDGD